MPLKKGNTNIESVYLGTTPIGAIYKGTTLIFESFKWLPYSFTYLYHSLIPNVISGKTNKDLARVSKIYANGEIENQLVNATDTSKTLTSGHKYLTFLNGVYALTNGTGQSISVVGGTDMVIDLTQQFGAGNEPTSLDDNRIKRIIAKGSIPYNTGTYKGTNIEAFESQPYNLFDYENSTIINARYVNYLTGELTTWGTGWNAVNNFIEIRPSTTYELYNDIVAFNSGGNAGIAFYDENKVFISGLQYKQGFEGKSLIFTTPNNAKYMRFCGTTMTKIALHVSSSLNGTYKPHIAPATLPFKYQGNGAINAHDTMEITKTEYVFTKNVVPIELDKLSYTYNNVFFFATINECVGVVLCPKYPNGDVSSSSTQDKVINFASSTSNQLRIKDSSYTDIPSFVASLNSVLAYCQLATPQVIRIPRKHLGIVDLGSLNWTRNTSYENPFFMANMPSDAYKPTTSAERRQALGFCSIYSWYQAVSGNANFWNNIANMAFLYNGDGGFSSDNLLFIRNDTYTDATAFKQAMAGTYLFYETQDEVADIDTEIVAQGGGELNALSQRLPSEYQEVEYLESTGTQYIDTEYKPNQNTRLEMTLKFSGTYVQGQGANIFGSQNSVQISGGTPIFTANFGSALATSETIYFWIGNKTYAEGQEVKNISAPSLYTSKNTIVATSTNVEYGNVSIPTQGLTYQIDTTLLLLSNTLTRIPFGVYHCIIYSTKLYENNTLVRDFVPCYRKADNVAGLYDLVNNTFYTNQGTGSFLVGANVNNNYGDSEVLPNVDFEFKCK